MLTEADLIKGCKEHNQAIQKALYKMYAPKMKVICLRYSNTEEAKDILQEGFIKVFSNISSYSNQGSFEGWIKRIMINTAISFYKKSKKIQYSNIDDVFDQDGKDLQEDTEADFISDSNFSQDDLMNAMNSLPELYKIVFNLFYLENHSHAEIAVLLSIDEKTSRTRLFRAKKLLQDYLHKLSKNRIGKRIESLV